MAKIDKNANIETYFRSVFQSSGLNITSKELERITNAVAEKMGIKEMWPGHPKAAALFDCVYQEIKLKDPK